MSVTVAHFRLKKRAATVLAGIRAGGVNLHRLPKSFRKTLSGLDASGGVQRHFVHLPLRGQRRLGLLLASVTLLLPVELRRALHTTSTNAAHSSRADSLPDPTLAPLQCAPMSNLSPIDQVTERVERLLLRHAELLRTNQLLNREIDSLTQERDSLKSRLNAARARVEALLERLPAEPAHAAAHPGVTPAFKSASQQDTP